MAQANVGRLFIDLEARTARIEADLNKANQSLDRQTKRMKRTAERNMKAMTNVITGLVGLGIGRLIGSTINAADHMAKFGTRIGESTEVLSQYRFVAERTGVTNQTLETGWQRMSRRIAEAAALGKGEAVPALQELQLNAKALADLKPHEQFELIADAMAEIPNQGDRVRLAMKLFDTEGVALLQTMEGGSAAIRELREEADRLGVTLRDDVSDQAEQFKDQLADIKARLTGLVQTFIPVANKIITGWTLIIEVTSEFVDEIARVGRALKLLDQDETQYRADRIAQIHDEMEAKAQLLATLEDEVSKLTALREAAIANNLETEAGAKHLKKITAERNLAKNELKALKFELEKLTKEQKDSETQGKKNIRVLSDYKGITESAAEATKRLKEEEKRLADAHKMVAEANKQLNDELDRMAEEAQKILDRLDPLTALTREYDEEVQKLTEHFGDDQEGLTAALEKLDDEYEENRQRLQQSTEEMRRQEVQAKSLKDQLQQMGSVLSTVNDVAGFNTRTGDVAHQFASFLPEPFSNIAHTVIEAVEFIRGIFGGGGLQNSEIVFGAGAQGQGGSPIIFPGIGGQRTLLRGGGSEFRDEFQGPAAQAATAFFAAFEAAATEEQINAASAALEGRSFVVRPEDVEGGRFLLPIFDAMLAAMDPAIQRFVGQFDEIGQRLEAFASVNVVLQHLNVDPVEAFAESMERASESTIQTLNRMGDELRDLGTDSFSSIEAMQRLGVSVQQYNQFVFQTLANIENARRSITGSTTSTIDALRFQTMDTGGQFNFLTTRAEQLAAGLGSMTDPAQIAATVAQINQLTQQAFSLGTPEQQAQLLDQFIPFLESVEAEAQARLEAIQMEVEQRAADDRAALQAIFDQGQVAASSNVIAAETQFAAAREFGAGVGAFRSVVGSIDYITNELVG